MEAPSSLPLQSLGDETMRLAISPSTPTAVSPVKSSSSLWEMGLAGVWCSSLSSTSMERVCSSPRGEVRDSGAALAGGASSTTGVIAMVPLALGSDQSSSLTGAFLGQARALLRLYSYWEMVASRPLRSLRLCSMSLFIFFREDFSGSLL